MAGYVDFLPTSPLHACRCSKCPQFHQIPLLFYVYVLEAANLPEIGGGDAFYATLRVGKYKCKTRVVTATGTKKKKKISGNPEWNDEFVFRVRDLDDDLVVSVYAHEDDSGLFNFSDKLIGRTRIPVGSVVGEDNQTLLPTWFTLENPKAGKSINKDCGKILLTLSLHGRGFESGSNHVLSPYLPSETGEHKDNPYIISNSDDYSSREILPKLPDGKHLVKSITKKVERFFKKSDDTSKSDASSELSSLLSDNDDGLDEPPLNTFEEAIEILQSIDDEQEMPENLSGGVLLDQAYLLSPSELNKFLFAPNSQFAKDLAELQGTTGLNEGNWTWKTGDMSCLTRVVTYIKAASKLVKAVKAEEEQTYVKANGSDFAILVSVSTPDVPYGNIFKVELLYKIMSGPEVSSGEEFSRLVISWTVNFSQSTMMKGMIEGGVRQGLKESFDQFSDLLARNIKVLDSANILDKDQMLASLKTDQQSDWELASKYFCNFTVISTALMSVYIILHLLLCRPREPEGLEFNHFELPHSFGEIITCGVLVLQLERVYYMILHFVQARLQRGSDHGVKSQGDGWVVTVALIEGINIASIDTLLCSDPYVVFTCNGKTRTSSVKLQTHDPQWSEILEFDAMDEPPSVLDVEVFDFEGPFDQATSLGHAEINFLKHTSGELADMWVSLDGKLAKSSQSKLHLRIFLDNNNGVETIKDYLTKMEKEVGKKLNLRSPHRNSIFQKLFDLPPEEFLIGDYVCSLKRKMLLQGRLFLSARIVGFYANLFGHKTKFFFLWEDIEDIHVLSPSLASVGSPSLVIVLRKGRGLDARHGAKTQDEEGRLKFYFQAFISFNAASRTIIASWRARNSSLDQNTHEEDEQQQDFDGSPMALNDMASVATAEELEMTKVYSAELPVSTKEIMKMFDGGELEYIVMAKSGCLNYLTTPWENIKPGLSERRLCYKFNRHISMFGGEVNCTQQRTPLSNGEGWTINEIMVLSNIPFGDHFHVKFRHEYEKLSATACKCDVYIRITWLKSSNFQQRITQNIVEKFTHRLKEIYELVQREILLQSHNT